MTWQTSYRIRYSECDQQGVVFNAWYQTYMDDAVDFRLRELDINFESIGWEIMVKASKIVWQTPAAFGDTLDLALHVSRWGNTSLDVSVVGAVGDRHVFDGLLTYVVVDSSDHRPIAVPTDLREHLAG